VKLLSLIAFVLCFNLSQAGYFEGETESLTRPVDVDVDFTADYFQTKPWVNEFHYVIVVNKANEGSEAQTINVYEYGQKIITSKVSTGRDQFERKGEHNSKRDSWTVTPTGFYTPSFLSKDHRSSAYGGIFSKITGGTKMPFAVFFNGDIALHQAPKGTEGDLGEKASGGCIRLSKEVAEEIFNRINEVKSARLPDFKVDGTIALDANGKYGYKKNTGFSALIVVINKIRE
jgi:hypothetical protein